MALYVVRVLDNWGGTSKGGLPKHSPNRCNDCGCITGMAEETSKTIARRACKPKVRTGCITCKIRHVKCGEEKPSCLKCTSTGRKCDGYEIFPKKGKAFPNRITTHALTSPNSLPLKFSDDPRDCQIIDYFLKESEPRLSGNFGANFWGSVVAIAYSEPIVKNALLGLGSLHQALQLNTPIDDYDWCHGPAYDFSMEKYQKAVNTLGSHTSHTAVLSDEVVLYTCALFICIEVLQGRSGVALQHLQNGLKILRQLLDSKKSSTYSTLIMDNNVKGLLQMFSRFDIQASTFLGMRPPEIHLGIQPRPFFGTVMEARENLDEILSTIHLFIVESAQYYKYSLPEFVPSEVSLRQHDLLSCLEDWLSKFDILLGNRTSTMTLLDIRGAMVLKIEYQIALISLSTALQAQQVFYDAFNSEFQQVITLAESLEKTSETKDKGTHFTIEMRIIHPLYTTACKCRELSIRQRAVALLKRAGREGTWNGPLMALVAEKVIELEEAQAIDGAIPEKARIHGNAVDQKWKRREIWVDFSRAKSDDYIQWESIHEVLRW